MSLLHEKSTIAVKSELDLFALPCSQIAIEDSKYISIRPIASTTSGYVDFIIPGSSAEYLDVSNLLLHVTAKIIKTDNTAFTNDDEVVPCNYLLHALWSQADVYLNDTLISSSNNLFAYKAYLECLLSTSESAQKTQLSAAFWYKDETERQVLAKNGALLDMIGKMHIDLAFQDKLLLNGVDLKIRLVRSKNEFCLETKKSAKREYAIQLDETTLYVKKVKVSPSILIAHTKALELAPAKYSFSKNELKSYTLAKSIKQAYLDTVVSGTLPTRVSFVMVDSEAVLGSMTKYCFAFEHFDVNFVSLHVDNKQFTYQPNFHGKCYAREYLGLLDSLGKAFNDDTINLSYKEYIENNVIFSFDLTPDHSASDEFWNLLQTGTVRLELHFEKALPVSVTIIFLLQFQALLTIDQTRTVEVDL